MAIVNAREGSLSLEDVALIRGGRLLFEHLTLSVAPGEAMLLMGPNGAGKSSLLRLMAGLVEPTEGVVQLPDNIGLLSSQPALKMEQRVADELRFWAKLDGIDIGRVRQAARRMGLEPLFDLRCGMLSDGQARRVAIARIMAGGASLWLLDEPTNVLDSHSELVLLKVIRSHLADGGSVVAVTHHPLPIEASVLKLG